MKYTSVAALPQIFLVDDSPRDLRLLKTGPVTCRIPVIFLTPVRKISRQVGFGTGFATTFCKRMGMTVYRQSWQKRDEKT
ncbi:MAG: hypothetical protein PHP85_03220 [Gallionella sp.]|nr:hypothetical protein [Gallionella sp.]